MNFVVKAILVPLLALAGLVAVVHGAGQEAGSAPAVAERYKALQQQFNETARGLHEAKSDAERLAVAERMVHLSPQFLELAEKNPDSAMAEDCLVQAVGQEIWLENNTVHPGGKWTESVADRAVALLLERHLQSPAMSVACQRTAYGFRKSCETLLRTVLEKTPHKEVRGQACLKLAQFLNNRMRRMDLLKIKPEMARRYEGLFGKEYLEELERMDRTKALAEVESLFERAEREFADVKLPYDVLVGTTATQELHEIRHLSVGREAQEIETEDQDGVKFKLSDYRGKKVVLLYFWSEY